MPRRPSLPPRAEVRTQAELLKNITTNALKLKEDLAKSTGNGDLQTATQAIKTYVDATWQYIYGAASSESENNTAGSSRNTRRDQGRFLQSSIAAEIRSIKKDALSLQQLIQLEEQITRERLLSTWGQNRPTSYAEHQMRVQEQWQHEDKPMSGAPKQDSGRNSKQAHGEGYGIRVMRAMYTPPYHVQLEFLRQGILH
ncbi:hypothetical protein B0T18DRAFT_394361 [Schizothecium vesticola]|uniref:Uncharacterized protein n=1 Tax=Schizothecium vesticola TaxID=314040 RepID=A0AA40BPF0_9PEZI|nr:hypothetical protein B0T18DRAFT_394361 [Schizothecium vesticola]